MKVNAPGSFWDGAEVISSYSRQQAIEDGVLVDLRQDELDALARQAGFLWPIACTARVFAECIDLTPAAKAAGNDLKGRLWDVLTMFKFAITKRRGQPLSVLTFDVLVVRDRVRPTLTTLKAVAGPDDHGNPCMTIMFPDED